MSKPQIFPNRDGKNPGDILWQSPFELQRFKLRSKHRRKPLRDGQGYYNRWQAFQLFCQALWEAQRGVSDYYGFGRGGSLRTVTGRLPDWFLTHWNACKYIDEILLSPGEQIVSWCDAFGRKHDFFGALAIFLKCYEDYHEVKFVTPSLEAKRLTFLHAPREKIPCDPNFERYSYESADGSIVNRYRSTKGRAAIGLI
jgi:hypothetical protein